MEKINDKSNYWKYCVAGNIVKSHYDKDGILRYGTPAFIGGTKVYLCGKIWFQYNYTFNKETIEVAGLSRGKRYYVESVPIHLIENVRCSKTFKPKVLEIMDDWDAAPCWWGNTKQDKQETEIFLKRWNKLLSGSDPFL